jgi:CHAT domain-containing protein
MLVEAVCCLLLALGGGQSPSPADRQDDARAAIEQALAEARRLGRELPEAEALIALAELDFGRARYAGVRELASESAAIFERLSAAATAADRGAINRGLGRSRFVLSRILEREGDYKAGTEHAERAVAAYDAAGDRRGRAVATLQLMRVLNSTEHDRALAERVIADARAVGDRVLEARALHSFGDHLFAAGSYEESLQKLEAAAALFEAERRLVDLGTVYNSLGRLYRAHGRADAALANQLKALAVHEQSNSPFSHLQSLNAVGVTYQSLGDSRRGRAYLERALALAEQTSTVRMQDFVRANLASTLFDEGDYARGVTILEGVLERKLDRFPNLRMRNLSYGFRMLGRHELAMSWAQQAVESCGDRDGVDCLWSLGMRAAAHASLGNDADALADLEAAMTAVEAVRARLVPADFLKQQFHLLQEDLYSRAIALQLRRGQPAAALEIAERARARAFVDLLASRDLPLQERHQALPLVFRGGDLRSTAAAPAATATDLVATAARLRSTLIAYWVTSDQVFSWTVAPDGTVKGSQVAVRQSKLLEMIRSTTPFDDADRPATPASPAWRELYDLLIKPLRHALPRTPGALLTIVPHGPLAALAFAGLQDEAGRYLLESFTLHYAPAGAALQFTAAQRRPAARRGRVLMVADPVPPALSTLDRPLPRLPGARAESRAIAALIPAARMTRFEGEAAQESVIRKAAADKSVLHFATHAIVHDHDPFSSFLALGRGDEDGLLTAQEIYRLRLDADLIVLSACRSGGGRVTGDGIATFARAFMYAGAPSIVASLWDVADEPTSQLLPAFYRSWLAGASKARALRTAQLSLLKELRAGRVRIDTPAGQVSLPESPVFWAGFALLGEPD